MFLLTVFDELLIIFVSFLFTVCIYSCAYCLHYMLIGIFVSIVITLYYSCVIWLVLYCLKIAPVNMYTVVSYAASCSDP